MYPVSTSTKGGKYCLSAQMDGYILHWSYDFLMNLSQLLNTLCSSLAILLALFRIDVLH